jgi:hypothetical protein
MWQAVGGGWWCVVCSFQYGGVVVLCGWCGGSGAAWWCDMVVCGVVWHFTFVCPIISNSILSRGGVGDGSGASGTPQLQHVSSPQRLSLASHSYSITQRRICTCRLIRLVPTSRF